MVRRKIKVGKFRRIKVGNKVLVRAGNKHIHGVFAKGRKLHSPKTTFTKAAFKKGGTVITFRKKKYYNLNR